MSFGDFIEDRAADALLPGSGVALGFARKAWTFLKPLLPWILLVAGIAAGLWAIERHGEGKGDTKASARFEKKIGLLESAYQAERKAFQITQASLKGARAEIDDNNRRIQLAADRLAADKAKAAKDASANAKLATRTDALIADLRAVAAAPRAPCTLSPAAKKALEGL